MIENSKSSLAALRLSILIVLPLTVIVLLALPACSLAAVTKIYSPSHSLTGGCAVSEADPVPDPGCPGGTHPPDGPFQEPVGVTTDSAGNVYVINAREPGQTVYPNAYIDIFDPTGLFLTSFFLPNAAEIAVDSGGRLYVYKELTGGVYFLQRLDPTVFDPEAGEIIYGDSPVTVWEGNGSQNGGLVVDPLNDHIYLRGGGQILEFAPPVGTSPNPLVAQFGTDALSEGNPGGPIAVDSTRRRLFAADWDETAWAKEKKLVTEIKVLDLEAPHEVIGRIDASESPAGKFLGSQRGLAMAVDESNGHLLTVDSFIKHLYEFDENFKYAGRVKQPTSEVNSGVNLAIDNSELSPSHGYVYAPSGLGSAGNLFAYEPKLEPKPPVVETTSVAGLAETEAVLRGKINPRQAETHWIFEYVTQEDFEVDGFTSAHVAGEGDLAVANEGISVSAPVSGLVPGTNYRFRLRAQNLCAPAGCEDVLEGSPFATFATDPQIGTCPNQALRVGASAVLPDCRAYELVSPADTGGLAPLGPLTGGGGTTFPTPPASSDGDSVTFSIQGGLIPGLDANGSFSGDAYRSRRTAAGWTTAALGPNGTQTTQSIPGGLSADHGYYAVETTPGEFGTLSPDGKRAAYVRFPDGTFHLAGEGALATQRSVYIMYISPGGSHILFTTNVLGTAPLQLEQAAPPNGTSALYDRTSDGTLHVVSLLPGEQTPGGGAIPEFEGISENGGAIAFRVGVSPIYLRIGNAKTLEAAPANAKFAGLSDDSRYLFYVLGGDLYRFDAESEETDRITDTGDVTPVVLGSQGSAAYFLSPSALPSELNADGAEPQPGAHNLYHWTGNLFRFVATVTPRDVEGRLTGVGPIDGLGLWATAISRDERELSLDRTRLSARTTPNGEVLVFESRSNLTEFDAGGMAEIFRYDATTASIDCLSCDPTLGKPAGDARLTSVGDGNEAFENPVGASSLVPNLAPDGRRAFFETDERLVVTDTDEVTDVYEWEAQGTGSCAAPGGCVFLISSGQSARPNRLVGVSESGDDVFIRTSDRLVAEDTDEAPSIYDVRVGGGFSPPKTAAGECLGEACQPAAVAPQDPTPGSSSYAGKGNVSEVRTTRPRCPKTKRNVRRAGRQRCVPRHAKQSKRAKRANAMRRAHR